MAYHNTWPGPSAQAGPSHPRAGPSIPTPSYAPQGGPMLHYAHAPAIPIPQEDTLAEPEPSPSPPAVAGLGQLVEPHQSLNDFLESFWTRQMEYVERDNPDFRTYPLPLARIKKVMKSDEEVKMISAEAPILFSKACELFISELTCRAWLIAESKKRRTLQKSDVAAAIALSDMFDFLIDILPRDDDGGGVEGNGLGGEPAVPDAEVETGDLAEDAGDVTAERDGEELEEEGENGVGQYIQEG